MTWHYLPVFITRGDEREYSLCEVYLNEDGRLEAWTASSRIAPSGDSVEELLADLNHMREDIDRWAPVEFGSLVVGMALTQTEI